jgi:hypothetical protein
MRFAYYEEYDYHTEIMGFLLDYCIENNHECDYFNDKDQSYFFEHYENKFKDLRVKRYKNIELRNKIDDYDYIVIGTMGHSGLIDDLIEPSKFLQVYHNNDDLDKVHKTLESYSNEYKKIVLTPLNHKVGPYLLPIFKSPNNQRPDQIKDKIVTMVGRFTNNRSYETLLPLLNFEYTIWIIARKPKFVPKPLINLSLNNTKLKIFYKLNAQKMSELLAKSRYILCVAEENSWYYKDRLTGTIPLSYNYDLPILIPSNLNKIYGMTGAVEYKQPENIPDLIKTIDSEPGKYTTLVQNLINQKTQIVEHNHNLLNNIFKAGPVPTIATVPIPDRQ